MLTSLRTLLEGAIDYAGLFPPAQLDLDAAIANYARFRGEPEAWLLGRFICPSDKLSPLASCRDSLFVEGPAFRFSVLGRGGATRDAFLEGVQRDFNDINLFLEYHETRVSVDAVELRLPGDAVGASREELDALLESVAVSAAALDQRHLPVFYEWPRIPETPETVANLTAALAAKNSSRRSPAGAGFGRVGLKLRCGGTEPDKFPTIATVARAIESCGLAGVPMKFTAGLHHPIRHYNAGAATKMHGFLNVLAAGVLGPFAESREATPSAAAAALVGDEAASSFYFDAERMRWRDHAADVGRIRERRRMAVLSFGSCSFDEPRDDLRALGLLPDAPPAPA